jgi:hypothetical protein
MTEKRKCEALGCHHPAIGRFTIDFDLNNPKIYGGKYAARIRLCKECKAMVIREGRYPVQRKQVD